jgi:pimeloyl-ACP methyl ester carboxylesterase
VNTIADFITVDGRKIYVESAGEGPALVLGHAGFLDSRQWDAQWEPFAGRYWVVRYDLGGYGKSDPLSHPIFRVQELKAVLDALGIERAALLGCSLSGSAAIDFTLANPDRVPALISVSAVPSGYQMEGEMPPALAEVIVALESHDFDRASEFQIRLWLDGPFRTPEQVSPDVRRVALEMNSIAVRNETWPKMDSQAVPEPGAPALERLKEIQASVLTIAGELDHPEVVRACRYVADHVPGGTFLAIPNAAHVPNMDDPATFNDAVLRFLDANLRR